MKKILTIFFFFIFILHSFCVAQFKKQIDSLTVLSNKVSSDSEKVITLGTLADIYYTYQLNRQGDSILQEQLRIADMADNSNLVLTALFGPALTNMSARASTESFSKTLEYLQKGIDFAKSQNNNNYIALGYARMANILLKRKQYDKALNTATQALQIMPHVNSDSIKAIIYIELGNSYLGKGEAVSAVRSYNNAFDIAVKIKSVPLQSTIYHCFSEMYFVFLNNKDVAKEFVKKSLTINKEHNNIEGQIWDYYDLSRITDERSYLEKAIELSEKHRFYKFLLKAKILMLDYYYVVDKNSDKALEYLENEPEVKESYINPGIGNYYQRIGHIYFFSDKYDSAVHYYKLAEYDFVKHFDESRTRGLFNYIAQAYQHLNDLPNAIAYYLRSLNLSKKANDAKSIASVSESLSAIYELQGDFKQAYVYAKQAKNFNDSLADQSKGRDIALLDVERENRKYAEEVREQKEKFINKRNLQYMAITIAIGVVFMVLLIIGMFPVSKLTIKILGYIFFISVFEFIVLLIDTFLHKITHGEPLKIWLIKIVIIAMLVPIQHYLEHTLIKFLESKKLVKARTRLNVKNWLHKTKKPAHVKHRDFEEGTAVL